MDCELEIAINTPEIYTRGQNYWHTKPNTIENAKVGNV
ncbi:hypothetical protein PSHI_04870 [Pseudomonas sp. URMO17WK12:I11]|nr:hypothetical protein PSHI_04870 [Pseudomonas sp. URMO17WK12:I11]